MVEFGSDFRERPTTAAGAQASDRVGVIIAILYFVLPPEMFLLFSSLNSYIDLGGTFTEHYPSLPGETFNHASALLPLC